MLKVHLGAVSWYNSDMVYLDYAATSPLLPEVIKAMHEAEENFFANASALHTPGHLAMNEIEKTRELLAEIINADPKDTMAIGDSINDRAMLETAGISVAMGRSSDRVKEICDHTTDMLENDGIWKALEKFDII